MNEYTKHPDATQDIHCTWPDLRAGERIVSSRWSALGLTVVADQIVAEGTVTVGWIAGGFNNSRYHVICAIITSLGRTLMRDILLHVSDDVPLVESQL